MKFIRYINYNDIFDKMKKIKRNLNPSEIIKIIESHKDRIRSYDVKKLGLFGSFLNRKNNNRSDMDFLVVFNKSNFDNYMGLKFLLEKIFNRKVDLVIEKILKPRLKYVKKEALYAKRL